MRLVLKLVRGSWFRFIYKGTDKEQQRNELLNSHHITSRIEFVDAKQTQLILKKNEVLIGRNKECSVVLDDSKVSRVQCELSKSGSQWIIKNMSRYGTRVSLKGEEHLLKNDETKTLWDGILILIGDTILEVTSD